MVVLSDDGLVARMVAKWVAYWVDKRVGATEREMVVRMVYYSGCSLAEKMELSSVSSWVDL